MKKALSEGNEKWVRGCTLILLLKRAAKATELRMT